MNRKLCLIMALLIFLLLWTLPVLLMADWTGRN